MSTNAELLDRVVRRLGNRTNATLRAAVLDEVNSTIQELEQAEFLPQFLYKETTAATVAGTKTLDLPTGFQRESDDFTPWYLDSNGNVIKLVKTEQERLLEDYGNPADSSLQGKPLHYAIVSDSQWQLGPVPDAVYTINLGYYKSTYLLGDLLVDDTNTPTNPWLLKVPNWPLYLAASVVAEFHIQNGSLAQKLERRAEMARRRYMNNEVANEEANADRSSTDKYAGD